LPTKGEQRILSLITVAIGDVGRKDTGRAYDPRRRRNPPRNPSWSRKPVIMLRRRLTFPAAALALVLSFVLTGLGIWAGNVIVSIMSNRLIEQMTEAVRREVDDIITFGDRMSTRMVNDIARHDIPLSDPVAVRRELYGLVSDEPNVRWLACGNEAGGMTDAGRLADGTIVFLMTDEFRAGVYREYEASPDGLIGNLHKSGVYFDTRENRWYTMVRDTRARYWTKPFLGSVERLLGVALSAPVLNKDGSFAGVCNVRLIFTALSDWMNSLRLGDNGRAFIIDATGHLIAASGGVSPVAIGADGKHLHLLASEAADPIVRETARHVGRYPEIAGPSSTGPWVFSVDDPERGRIYAAADRFEAPGEIKWTIISAVPASDFLGPVYRAAYLSIAIGAVVVAVFLVLGRWVVGRTLRPLTALTQAAQAIAKGEWRDVPAVQRNDEVGLLAHAFTVMTARLKETLDGLRRSEARLEEAQRVAHVGYWERDLDTNRITWSDETYRIYGLTPGEATITVAGMLERIHPEDRPIWSQAAAEALRGASHYDLEYRVVRPNAELRIVHSQGDLTRDTSGRPGSMFGTIQDITDRKRAADALRASEERWRAMFETASVGIMTFDSEHHGYLTANKSFQLMTGYTYDELRNLQPIDITHEDDRAATQKLIDDIVAGPQRSYRIEKRYRRRNGEIVWADVDTFFVPATDSTPAFFGVMAVDITDRKRAEEAFQQAQADLARLNRVMLLGEMTASIAHEVNQPISAVITNANAGLRWLGTRQPDLEEVRQALGRIVREGTRAGEVIGGIRALAKKMPPRRDLLDINQAIREAIALTQSEMQRNSVRWQNQLADDLPLVSADRVQLQQVMINLIVNAIEAMGGAGDGPRELVIVSGMDDANGLFVDVQDTGPGLDPQNLDRMFQSFYTTKPDGIGMGLAISRSIAEGHGGRLSAAPNEPRGAVFRLTLPVEEKSSKGVRIHRVAG
jgi:PAS domain S-box-containing protein